MKKKMLCREIIEVIKECIPDCPLINHCNLYYKVTCQIPKYIYLDKEKKETDEDVCRACKDPDSALYDCYCDLTSSKTKKEGKKGGKR